MARRPRVEEPGGIYHVTARGNDKQPIYFDDLDYENFERYVERSARRYRWDVLALCCLTNHYHLALRIRDGGLSRGMQELNGGYSRCTNVRYGRTMHLFKNRFYGEPIETDAHLLEVVRYIFWNPVRAGLARHPEEWERSSYAATIGLVDPPSYLAVDEVLGLLGPTRAEAVPRLRAFLVTGSDPVTEVSRPVAGRTVAAR